MLYSELHSLEKQKVQTFVQTNAYYLWQERTRMGVSGTDVEDWLQAEKWMAETFPYLDPRLYDILPPPIEVDDRESLKFLMCPVPTCRAHLGERDKPVELVALKCPVCGTLVQVVLVEKARS